MTTANHDVIHFVEKLVQSKAYQEERRSARAHPDGDQLYDYVLGWLEPGTEMAVRRHLAECAACMDEVLRIQAFEQAVDKEMSVEASQPDSQEKKQSPCH